MAGVVEAANIDSDAETIKNNLDRDAARYTESDFWCQRTRRWIRCAACGFWLCLDCNVDPVHCQNEREF